MPECSLLGDEASVQVVEHKRLGMPEVIRSGDSVVGELLRRDCFERRPARPSVATVVVEDQLQPIGERRECPTERMIDPDASVHHEARSARAEHVQEDRRQDHLARVRRLSRWTSARVGGRRRTSSSAWDRCGEEGQKASQAALALGCSAYCSSLGRRFESCRAAGSLVVRGGSMSGIGMGSPAFIAASEEEVEALCGSRLVRFRDVVVFKRGDLERASVEIVPTFRVPHVTLCHPDLAELVGRLLRCDHRRSRNSYHVPDEGTEARAPTTGTRESTRTPKMTRGCRGHFSVMLGTPPRLRKAHGSS